MANTKLHTAVDERDESGLRGLLIEGKTSIDAVDSYGRTALGLASFRGRVEHMKILIAYDAELNACRKNGQPPLHSAIMGGNMESVRLPSTPAPTWKREAPGIVKNR